MSATLTLPQFEQDRQQRLRQLEAMRIKYAYSLTYDGEIATINQLPKCENPGVYYQFKALTNAVGLVPSLPGVLWKSIKHGLFGAPFKRVQDYIFFGLTPFADPNLRQNMWQDDYLGLQMVAGANPVMLQGINQHNPIPKEFDLAQASLAISQAEYDEGLANERLYIASFAMVNTLQHSNGSVDGHPQYTTAPIALFYLQDDGNLRPLAIQLDANAKTSDNNPVITPADGNRWKLARTCLMAANGAVHDLWTHAVQIHYVLESIIMASYRQLASNHPLLALLDPHLQYTLAVNVHPLYERDNKGKIPYYGKMFPGDNDALVKFMGEGMRSYRFRERAFPNDLKRRAVTNPKLNYPYRDDGLPLWQAIMEFVEAYVDVYYKSDQYVIDDSELQAWAQELGGEKADGSCGLEDFPSSFNSKQEVVDIFGQIIFTATAHHSAVHYPQDPYSQFVPNMPNALYANPFELLKTELDQSQLMQLLPPFKVGFFQAFLYYAVNFKVNRIGEYPRQLFCPQAIVAIQAFQQKLQQISAQHQQKYRGKSAQYPYMDPKNIPNGVTA